MSIIGIDIGTSTTKIIEYKNNKINNSNIYETKDINKNIEEFLNKNKIETQEIEKIVLTGIGADKVNLSKYNVPVHIVEEFVSVAKGGLYLANKKEAIIVSVGTGTALIKVTPNEIKHLGGTGVGAGTLINLCKNFTNIKTFEEILELSNKGNLEKIDLRIGDVTTKNIDTLPKDLTLSNFGKISEDAKKEDIVLGILNMIFEVIGMMAAFATINDNIKDVVLIGNIAEIPVVKQILKKIEYTHKISFIIPENPQYAVALGAIKSI